MTTSKVSCLAAIGVCAAFWGCGSEAGNAAANVTLATPQQALQTDGIVAGTVLRSGKAAYAGGPVIGGPIQVVPIFYGTSWLPLYQSTILSFLETMSSSSYWAVVEQYADSTGNKPGAVSVEAVVYETDYAYGKSLTPENIQAIVQSQGVPASHDPTSNTIYLVYTADDVNQVDVPGALGDQPGNFCTKNWGWHWDGTFTYRDPERRFPATVTTEYAWIGSLEYCLAQGLPGFVSKWGLAPNGATIDQSISVTLHELAESVTDPIPLTGWFPEIGDTCNFIPGPEETQSSCVGATCFISGEWDLGFGAPYTSNQIGYSHNQGAKYLVQTIWDVTQKGCAYGPAAFDP